MADRTTKYLEIEIDEGDALKDLAKLQTEIDNLKNSQKELATQSGKNSEEYQKNDIALKALQKQYNQNRNGLVALKKSQDQQNGTIQQTRDRLTAVSAAWAKEAKAVGENSERAKALAKEKARLTDALKKEERATGDARRNVGNYNEGLERTQKVMVKVRAGALLLVGAIVGLARKFKKTFNDIVNSTQETGDRFQQVMTGMKSSVDVFFQSIASGDWTNLIENMQKAYEAGVQYAKQLDRLYDMQNAQSIRAAQLRAQEAEQMNILRDRTFDYETRQAAMNKLLEIKENLMKEEQAVAEENYKIQLENLTKLTKLSKEQIEDIFTNIELQDKMSSMQEKWDNLIKEHTKTIFNQQTLRNEEYLDNKAFHADKMKMFDDEDMKLLELNKQWNLIVDTKEDDVKATRDSFTAAAIGLANVQEGFQKSQSEVIRYKAQLETLLKGEEARAEKLQSDTQKQIDATNRLLDEFNNSEIAKVQIRQSTNEQLLASDQELADATITNFEKGQVDQRELRLKYQQDLLYAEDVIAGQHEVMRIERDKQLMNDDYQAQIINAQLIGADTTQIEEAYSAAKKQIAAAEAQAKLGLAADFANNIATIAGKNSKVGKAAAAAATTINALQSATGAYASLAPIPIIGPVLGATAAAAALAAGYVNVKKIYQTKSGLPGDSGGGSVRSGSSGMNATRAPENLTAELGKGLINRDLAEMNKQDTTKTVLVVDDVTEAQTTEDRINDVSSF